MLYTLILMLLGMVGLQVFAHPICAMFALSGEVEALCVSAMRIVTLGYLFAGVNIAFQGVFQALGCGVKSLIVSLLRLIVVTLPLAWVFAQFANAQTLIWACFPIAEAVGMVVAFVLYGIVNKQKIAPMRLKLQPQ